MCIKTMCFRKRGRRGDGTSALHFLAWSSSSMSVPVTRFSMRLYGSRMAVEKEQQRQVASSRWVIHPYSNVRFYWDLVSLVLLIISMLVIPVAITFFNDEMTSVWPWVAFNLTLDSWFFLDMVLNFHTGIIVDKSEGEVILDLCKIRCKYAKTWFFIDLVSTLPIDYIMKITSGESASGNASRAVKLFRFLKLISLLRLLRISRLIRYVHQWEQVAQQFSWYREIIALIVGMQYDLAVAAVRIFNLVCLMLLIGHWNGCLQFLIPMLYEFPNDSWIIIDGILEKPWGEQYSWSVFKAMSHMLCIGYGQQPPQNMMDLWMTMLSMVSGAVCFAMFIGHATALIQSMDSSKRQYKEKYMQVKEYMRYRKLPKLLRDRVYKYYENRYQGKMFDEDGILNELSSNLREEIVNYNCRHLVASVPYFQNAEADFVTEVVQKLKFEVFQPKDVIIKEGTYGKKMYFIQHGIVEVRKSASKSPIVKLSDGSFFGEICLLIHERRVASVIATNFCQIYSLHVDDFNDILEQHPVMRQTLEEVAVERLSGIGEKNEVLKKKLRKLDDNSSEAKSLAARIVKHDETPDMPRFRSARWQNMNRNLIQNREKHKTKQSKTATYEEDTTPYRPPSAVSRNEEQNEIEKGDAASSPVCLSSFSKNNGNVSSPRKNSMSSSTSTSALTRLLDKNKLTRRRLSKPKLLKIGRAKKSTKYQVNNEASSPKRPSLPKRSVSSPDCETIKIVIENGHQTLPRVYTHKTNSICEVAVNVEENDSESEVETILSLPLPNDYRDHNGQTPIDGEYIMMKTMKEDIVIQSLQEEELVRSVPHKNDCHLAVGNGINKHLPSIEKCCGDSAINGRV